MSSLRYRLLFSLVIILTSTSLVYSIFRSDIHQFINEQLLDRDDSEGQSEKVDPEEILPRSEFSLDTSQSIGLGVMLTDTEQTKFQSVLAFEKMIQRKVEYIMFFKAWGDEDNAFPSEQFKYIESLELTPVITWEPWKRDFDNPSIAQPKYTFESIWRGDHDDYIREWAQRAKSTEHPVIIRFGHEATTPVGFKVWYPWQGDPEGYVKAFRRIVTIFRVEKANNVEFMWSPIVFSGYNDTALYYPGDSYVDVIGFTIINLGKGLDSSDQEYWLDCNYLLNEQYKAVKNNNKSIIIAELLSSEVGGSKAAWYTQCFDLIKQSPRIIGVISVQIDQDFQWAHNPIDWRINSSQESLESFMKGINSGGFK